MSSQPNPFKTGDKVQLEDPLTRFNCEGPVGVCTVTAVRTLWMDVIDSEGTVITGWHHCWFVPADAPDTVEVSVADLELLKEWVGRDRDTPFTKDGANVIYLLQRLVSSLPDPDAELRQKIHSALSDCGSFSDEVINRIITVIREES